MYLLKNDTKNVFITCIIIIIIIHFHPLLLLLMLRNNATNILRMVRILRTSVDGTVRSVTQQEVRSRAKDFLPPLLLTLFLHLAVCFWPKCKKHIYINSAAPSFPIHVYSKLVPIPTSASYIIMHANLESDGDDCVCVALASKWKPYLP